MGSALRRLTVSRSLWPAERCGSGVDQFCPDNVSKHAVTVPAMSSSVLRSCPRFVRLTDSSDHLPSAEYPRGSAFYHRPLSL